METKQDEQNRRQGQGQNDPHSTASNVTRPERAAHVDEVIQALKGITGLNADQKRVVDAQIAVLRGNPTQPESGTDPRGNPAGRSTTPEFEGRGSGVGRDQGQAGRPGTK